MDILKTILALVFEFLNSGAGIATVASATLLLLNYVNTKKPLWTKYRGAILSAIKQAEKAIPNDTENKGLAKLDFALRYVVKVHEDLKGRDASVKEIAEIKDGINLMHDTVDTTRGV